MSMDEGLNFGDLYKEATTILTGTFDIVFISASAAQTSTNKPMLKYKAQTEGGPHHGHVFYGNITISAENQAALRIFFSQMEAIGFNGQFMSQLPKGPAGLEAIAQAMVGRRATFEVESRQWQGVDRESVSSIKPSRLGGPGAGGPPMAMGTPGPATVPPGPSTPAGPPASPSIPAPAIPTTPTSAAPQTPPVPPTTPPSTPSTSSVPSSTSSLSDEAASAGSNSPPALPY